MRDMRHGSPEWKSAISDPLIVGWGEIVIRSASESSQVEELDAWNMQVNLEQSDPRPLDSDWHSEHSPHPGRFSMIFRGLWAIWKSNEGSAVVPQASNGHGHVIASGLLMSGVLQHLQQLPKTGTGCLPWNLCIAPSIFPTPVTIGDLGQKLIHLVQPWRNLLAGRQGAASTNRNQKSAGTKGNQVTNIKKH